MGVDVAGGVGDMPQGLLRRDIMHRSKDVLPNTVVELAEEAQAMPKSAILT